MNKYERHGLTRAEDDILGGFGVSTDMAGDPNDTIRLESLTSEQHDVVRGLIRRNLLETHVLEDLSVEVRLTPTGKALHRVRSKEEEEGLPPEARRMG